MTYVEPPISPAFCSEFVTDCRRSTLDDFDNFVISNSIYALALPGRAAFWPLEGLRQMDVLDDLARQESTGGLIVAHVMLPHDPFALDRQCAARNDADPSREKYLDQVACLTTRLAGFLDAIPSSDVVLIFGDHGVRPEHDDPYTYEAIEAMLSPFVGL